MSDTTKMQQDVLKQYASAVKAGLIEPSTECAMAYIIGFAHGGKYVSAILQAEIEMRSASCVAANDLIDRITKDNA
jgi:pyrimidine operon attenuation protein/uracil phosphoribosyltransferase